MLRRFLGLMGLCAIIATTASGQTPQNEWTPWEEDPTCLLSANQFPTPDAKQLRPSPEKMILQWYIWGDAFITNADLHSLYDFKNCFWGLDCGLPKDADMFNRLSAVGSSQGRDAFVPGGPVTTFFSQPPPPEAIKFAAKGIGRCFGKASQDFTLEELGLVEVNTPLDACKTVVNKILSPTSRKPPYSIDREFVRYPEVNAWGRAVGSMIGFNAIPPTKPIESCSVAPTRVVPILNEFAARSIAADTRAREEAEAERVRLTNRTDEERFQGLNGCQIAYSLVFQGINSRDRTVGKVPKAGISWALAYEKANLREQACPVIPDDLSEWIQKQPMATFQAEPDPYTSFRQRKKPSFGTSYDDWLFFVDIWMSRYETQSVSSNTVGSDCDAVLAYARSDRFSARNEDNGPSAFATLARLSYKPDAGRAMCTHAPTSMVANARQYYDAEVARKRQAYEAEMKKRQTITPATLPKQNYLWKSAPSTRCYWSGDTKYGQKNVCFTN